MRISRSAALAAALLGAAPAGAEPLVFVRGAALRSGEIDEIFEIPGGPLLRATDLIAEFWRTAQDEDALLAYDLETGRFRDDTEHFLGAAGIDRLGGSHDWFAYDAAQRGFVPLGQGPIVPNPSASAPSDPLAQPGAVLVAVSRPLQGADTDGDGVPDSLDVCILAPDGPLEPGPLELIQRDTDGDGFGNACDADLSNDGIVNFNDLALLKQVFFRRNQNADLNGDGIVNFTDLARMKASFFAAPGPSGRVRR